MGRPPKCIGSRLRLGEVEVPPKFLSALLEHSTLSHAGLLGWSAAAIPDMQKEKGRSRDLPFSLNKFRFCAVIAVQQRCCIRLFGRFLPKLRPPSRAAFFTHIPVLANCLLHQLSYFRFLQIERTIIPG